ncbi:unnamed protein product [Sphagnum balticum]
MGNRALIKALHNLQESDSSSLVKGDTSQSSNSENIVQLDKNGALENVIFLALDAVRDKFEERDLDNVCKYRSKKKSPLVFTIYSSAADQELLLSRRFHEPNQLVDTQSLVQMKNLGNFSSFTRPIVEIHASGVDINMSRQHSYMYLDHKFLHDDIAKGIRNLLS